jgi:cell division transport system permease protein
MISRIEFMITEAFLGLRRHPAMAFAAAVCVAATLSVAGIVGLALVNAGYAVDTVISQYTVSVYFKPSVVRADAQVLWNDIRALPGVAKATFITREDAWETMKKQLNDPNIDATLGGNPLPDRVDIQVASLESIPALEKEIASWPKVDKVAHEDSFATNLDKLRKGVTTVGSIIGIILLALSLVIIHHTIELTLYARRKEITIMGLVGATPTAIALPFALEGIVYGFLGGSVATLCLGAFYKYAIVQVRLGYNTHLLDTSTLWLEGLIIVIAAGMLLGLSGALASVIKYLRNPRSKVTNA